MSEAGHDRAMPATEHQSPLVGKKQAGESVRVREDGRKEEGDRKKKEEKGIGIGHLSREQDVNKLNRKNEDSHVERNRNLYFA